MKNHFTRNLKQFKIAEQVPTPSTVEKMEEPPMLLLIYKAIFYCLSVLLDIRYNTSQNKSKPFKKPDNPVIKPSDLKIKIIPEWMDHLEKGAKLGKPKESDSEDTNN